MEESARGYGRRGGGGRRPRRSRSNTPHRSSETHTPSNLVHIYDDDNDGEDPETRHTLPIYDSSEFIDKSGEPNRRRGGRGRSNFRGRGRRGESNQRGAASTGDFRGGRGGGRGYPRGQNSNRGQGSDGRPQNRFMGYKRLEGLHLEDDPDDVLLQLVTTRNGFEDLLEKRIDKDWMFMLVAILVKAYKSNKERNCSELTRLLSSKQLIPNHLIPFVAEIEYGVVEYDDDKMGALLWNLCQLTLILFQNMQSSLPLLITILDVLERLVTSKYKVICEISCPDIFAQLETLKEAKDAIKQDYIKKKEEEEKPRKRPQPIEQEPPDDFRELSVLPTLQDLQFNKKPFLRCNKSKGGYDDLQQYLDIQFRLLREDYLHPLREGILDYRRELEVAEKIGKKRQTDIRMYENVEILRPLCSRHGVRHVIKFDDTKLKNIRWESSRRLMYGSLLCLSSDGFQSMLFATVTERKITDLQNGILEVQFTEGTEPLSLSSTQTYIMAETTAYFEAYRYILQGLQEVGDEMPLQSCIVHCKPNAKPPKYLNKGTVIPYDFSPLCKNTKRPNFCPVLNTSRWPSARDMGFDDSQQKALQMAITKEIAIIQGPPGTGKTYVGLKIVELLLHNKEKWTENTKMDPILVVCYTNHALDQFLVGISKHSEKLVRIGGRCKTAELDEFSLQNYRKKAREDRSISRTIHEKKYDCLGNMRNCREQIEQVSAKLKSAKQGILQLKELSPFMDDDHALSLQDMSFDEEMTMFNMQKSVRQNRIDKWLGFNTDMMLDPNDFNENIENQQKNILMLEWEEELIKGSKIEKMERDVARLVKKPWQLTLHNRGALYKYLLKEFQDFVGNEMMVTANEFGQSKKGKKRQNIPNQEKIDELLKIRTRSEKVVLQCKMLISHIPNYLKKIPKMILEQGDVLDWLYLDGSPESCSRIAEVLREEYIDAKEEADYEDEERRLEEEDEDDELRFFSGYSSDNDNSPSQTLSGASLAILYKSTERSEKSEGWIFQINRSKMRRNLRKIIDSSDIMTEREVDRVKDIWKLEPHGRQRLYRYWLNCYTTQLKESIKEAEKQYDDLCKGYREVLDAEDVEIMRGADVIGMTTTGAAKYRNILQSIKPKIIIVEEAAEVLESHIVTTINSNCQHLILIGDHKQLRPTPTVYHLAKNYNLDISLFERMVNNDLNYVTLGIQHRMRPEISTLMRYKDLYPDLDDHEDVKKYEHIKGVICDIYFINHNEPELVHGETKSKSNIHEAKFVKRLCRYFLQQDYDRSQITILTAYTGQILAMKKEMPKQEFEGVRITSVDNYQGEENDIIILSLVRSNNSGSTGFLKIDNRVCVALSRARKGLYVIGNFDLLCSESELWKYIVDTMKANGTIGRGLVLRCGNHPRNSVSVSYDTDFDQVPNGGCTLPCNYNLKCSHKCGQICHISDPNHEFYKCLQPCLKKCDKGHSCPRKCFQDCGNCPVKVLKTMPSCGHIESVPCSIEERVWSCKSQCGQTLSCSHNCKGKCGNCTSKGMHEKCEEPCEKQLSCGHSVFAKCFEDAENLKCTSPCGSVLECGHNCSGSCGDCLQGRLHIPCQSKCGRKLICGHICFRPCIEGCPPCNQKCRTACPHRRCGAKCCEQCEDCQKPCTRNCEHQKCKNRCDEKCDGLPCSKNCSLKLPCQHGCMGVCSEKCPFVCEKCHRISFEGSYDNINNDIRFVALENCGHFFSIDSMDLYMFNPTMTKSSSVPIGPRQCPACPSQITKSLRYKSVIEEYRKDVEVIKQKMKNDDISVVKRETSDISRKVSLLKSKDPNAVDLIFQQLEEKDMLPIERVNLAHLQMLILEIIYNIYQQIIQSAIESTKEEKMIGEQLNRIRDWLFERVRTVTENKQKIHKLVKRTCFSKQELLDVRLELIRLAYQVQFLKLKTESRERLDKLVDKYGSVIESLLTTRSKLLEKNCRGIRLLARTNNIGLDDSLFDNLVCHAALERHRTWQYGTWFKCKKGHISKTYQEKEQCPSCDLFIGMKTYENIVPPRRIVVEPLPEDQKEKPRPSPRSDKNLKRETKKHQESSEQSFDLQTGMQYGKENFMASGLYLVGTDNLAHTPVGVASFDTTRTVPRDSGGMVSASIVSEQRPAIKPKPEYAWQNTTPNQEIDEAIPSNPYLVSGNSMKSKSSISQIKHDDECPSVISGTREKTHKSEQNMGYEWKKTSSQQEPEKDVYMPSYKNPVHRLPSGDDKQTEKKIVYTSDELLKFRPNQLRVTTEQNILIGNSEGLMSKNSGERSKISELPKAETVGKSLRSPIDIDISLDNAQLKGAQVAVSKPKGEEQRETGQTVGQSSAADQHRNSSQSKCPKGHIMLRNETKCRWCENSETEV